MSDVKYVVVLPTNPQYDRVTEVAIRGTLLQEPQQFSINFVNSPSCTDNITYHFKVNIPSQKIIQNYKSEGEWSASEQQTVLNIFDGKSDSNKSKNLGNINGGLDAANNYSFTEAAFSLEFKLDYENSSIRVHQRRGKGANYVTEYETFFSLSEIQSIQIWGDIKKINQFSLNYD
ncbi:uncharacterized protein LOC133835886 isoform X1 [Drosophila sulfurigaster albostrigata]|uniref:uncharacterized protein LOC133835886 isoform X1 n=1 Tax=Drosophila sulfurigaster albostrigata TaxID=89887 RepID=UPI002D21AD99|nr:uncharacterized protein LOC133835886 isoform X1 [Drosophila sulfurigaster albostrigata]XP_062122009.1 uncharacterized protein LOC133835886 isoform X1 [Drosophila sulfurigaster albostrigata]XP_062122010.1 uncharacterized protein LOC133835886 isoform X1 [Drosophila sulfurigaster albostrigata]XP_062122011.1 uncharacterized protein LOC133835886 isoform X1 [Drosophila sulfurigaster albostrigata]